MFRVRLCILINFTIFVSVHLDTPTGRTTRRASWALPATVLPGRYPLGILYLFLVIRPPAHWRASAHFFSEISRLRWATDLGSRFTPRVRFSAASSAHSSPVSLSRTTLWVGHHQISVVISGRALGGRVVVRWHQELCRRERAGRWCSF
jgi:hypothetical protein